MTVESATFLSQLNVAYPAGGDPTSEWDDHLRLLKSCIQDTFPATVAPWAVPVAINTAVTYGTRENTEESISRSYHYDVTPTTMVGANQHKGVVAGITVDASGTVLTTSVVSASVISYATGTYLIRHGMRLSDGTTYDPSTGAKAVYAVQPFAASADATGNIGADRIVTIYRMAINQVGVRVVDEDGSEVPCRFMLTMAVWG